jgi:ketosteroid isomerase-like protein
MRITDIHTAKDFAQQWIAVWNAQNLEDILNLYSDDIEVTSPKIKVFPGVVKGTLKGKSLVAEYWGRALQKTPNLFFDLIDVTISVNSVALYYKSVLGKMAIEVMFFNEEGKVNRMFAHYS